MTDDEDADPLTIHREDQVKAKLADRIDGMLAACDLPDEAHKQAFRLGAHAAMDVLITTVHGLKTTSGLDSADEQLCAEKVILQALLDWIERHGVKRPWAK